MKTQGSHETTNQKGKGGKLLTTEAPRHEDKDKGPDAAAREEQRRKQMEEQNKELNPKDPEPTKPGNPEGDSRHGGLVDPQT